MLLNKKAIQSFFIALSLIMASEHSMARMYKWVDSNGVTQYSQQPPPEGPIEEIERGYKPEAADLENTLKEKANKREKFNKQHQERLDKKAQTEKLKEEKKKLAASCASAREKIKALKIDKRMQVKEGGAYTSMTAEMRQKKIRDLQAKIDEGCN